MFDVPQLHGHNVPQKAEDIIFFSCDYDYFDRHGYALAQSINRTLSWMHVHCHIIDEGNMNKEVLDTMSKNYNFTIINVAGPAHKNFKKSEYIFGISKFVKIVAKEAIDLNANLINVSSISARDYKLKKNTNIYFYGQQKHISEKIIIKLLDLLFLRIIKTSMKVLPKKY